MGLTVDEADRKANWAIVLSLVALLVAIFSPLLWNMATYAPVWTTRPPVINFPDMADTNAWTRNPNVMKRQLTRQQIRALHDRHGPQINFPNWQDPTMQPVKRPNPMEKNWWGNR